MTGQPIQLPPQPPLGAIVRREPDDGRRWKRTDVGNDFDWELWARRTDGRHDGYPRRSWTDLIIEHEMLMVVEDDLVPAGQIWRVGSKLGRTVYRQTGAEPHRDDQFLGIFDSADNARMVCELVNRSSRKDAL